MPATAASRRISIFSSTCFFRGGMNVFTYVSSTDKYGIAVRPSKGGRVGSDPHSDGRSEDEALGRHRPPKAGVAPDSTTTPPTAPYRQRSATTACPFGLQRTQPGEGTGEVRGEGRLQGYLHLAPHAEATLLRPIESSARVPKS